MITAPDVRTLEAVPFDVEDHLDGTLEVLFRLRSTDAVYPPAGAGTSSHSLEDWLLDDAGTDHWVALINGAVAGHVGLTPPRAHLNEALADLGHVSRATHGVLEIGRFFTDPIRQGQGIGSELFGAAIAAAEETGHQPALSVLGGSESARSFCADKGLQELGSVIGVNGRRFVFVRDPAATRADRFEAMRQGLYNLLG